MVAFHSTSRPRLGDDRKFIFGAGDDANLIYNKSARNFGPVMAMAADLTIVEARHIVDLGEIDPEIVVTPGVFVDRVCHVPALAAAA